MDQQKKQQDYKQLILRMVIGSLGGTVIGVLAAYHLGMDQFSPLIGTGATLGAIVTGFIYQRQQQTEE